MRRSTPNIARRIKSIIHQYDPNAKVYLYGSRATGKVHPKSDWDVLILLSSDVITSEMERKVTSPHYLDNREEYDQMLMDVLGRTNRQR